MSSKCGKKIINGVVSLDLQQINENLNSETKFGKFYRKIEVGSTVIKNDRGRWHIPPNDTAIPKPANIKLMSITEVCSNLGYWKKCLDNRTGSNDTSRNGTQQQLPASLEEQCEYLENALKTYAKHLQLKQGTFNSIKIIITKPYCFQMKIHHYQSDWYGLMVHMDFLNQYLAVQEEKVLILLVDGGNMILKMTKKQKTVGILQEKELNLKAFFHKRTSHIIFA